jgi:hypothetical protein
MGCLDLWTPAPEPEATLILLDFSPEAFIEGDFEIPAFPPVPLPPPPIFDIFFIGFEAPRGLCPRDVQKFTRFASVFVRL